MRTDLQKWQERAAKAASYWVAFNKLRSETLPVQGYSQGEPGDSSAGDQNAFNVCHFFLQSLLFF
jgi:hypothetical protein